MRGLNTLTANFRNSVVGETARPLKLPHDYQYDDAKPEQIIHPGTPFGDPVEVVAFTKKSERAVANYRIKVEKTIAAEGPARAVRLAKEIMKFNVDATLEYARLTFWDASDLRRGYFRTPFRRVPNLLYGELKKAFPDADFPSSARSKSSRSRWRTHRRGRWAATAGRRFFQEVWILSTTPLSAFDSAAKNATLPPPMKHLTRILSLTALVSAVAFAPADAQAQDALKIGVVDMSRVFGEYYKTKDAETELETKKEGARKEVEEMEGPLKELAKKIDGLRASVEDPAISPELRQSKTVQLKAEIEKAQGLQKEIIEFARRRESQLLEMFNRRRDVLLTEISEGVKARSVKEGYDLVFDKSAQSVRGVQFLLYSKDARDISGEMIAELNAAKP